MKPWEGMRGMKIERICVLAVLAVSMVLAGCTMPGEDSVIQTGGDMVRPQAEEAGARQERAGYERGEVYYTVGMHINVPYWQAHRRGLEVAANQLGVKWVFTGETGNDAVKQMEIFDQVLQKNPAGILVSPIDPEGMTAYIDKAVNMGIPVICIDTDAPKSKRLCYLGADNYNAGYTAANILATAIGGAGDVGVLCIPGVFSIDERVSGFKKCIEENFPNVHVVSIQNDEGNPSKAASATMQMLQSYPTIKGIYGGDSISGVGASAALRELGRVGQIKVVSMDRDASTLELIEDGTIEATMVQRTLTMSYYGARFLYDYNHENLTIANEFSDVNPLPQHVDTGFFVVDKSNVSKFKE